MTEYYIVIIGAKYNPKNKLQKEIQEFLSTQDRKIITVDNLDVFKKNIIAYPKILNHDYPKCKPLQPSWWTNNILKSDTVTDWFLSFGDVHICDFVLRQGLYNEC